MKKKLLLVCCLVLALGLTACSQEKEKPLSYRAPEGLKLPLELEPVSSPAWSEAEGMLVLAADSQGLVEGPAWWSGNRPPAGEIVVLEVDYRDDPDLLVRAEVYSGMSSGNPYSELHRFGGAGDGTWKTARIPCPWDLALLYLPSSTIRFRLIPEGRDAAIRGLRLVEPRSSDERTYNAETRAWVGRVQHSHAQVDPKYYELAQSPVLPEPWAESPLVPYHRSWMDMVLPISAPRRVETLFPVSVRMALNEYQPLQLGIYANGKNLSGVEVSIDPVTDEKGAVVAGSYVRVAEYSLVASGITGIEIEPFPQRLWPAYPFEVQAGESHMVWIVLHTSEKISRTGKYSTTIHLSADGQEEVTIGLDLEILPYRLLTMKEADLKLGGHIRGLVPEHDLAFQREYNHNMADLWYGAIHPELTKQGESFSMDFRLMDDWMAAAARQGFTDVYYFLGGNPYGFPMTMDLERDLAKTVFEFDDEGWSAMAMENPDSVPRKLAGHLVEWARRLGEHAEQAGWPRLVLTPFDEPAKWIQTHRKIGSLSLALIKPHFIHWARLLREGYPEAPIAADIHHYNGGMDFLSYLDIFCTNATHENTRMPDEVRAAGKVFWEFSGCNDKGIPDRARYVLGFYFAAHDSRAAQLWAYNWGKRFDTLEGSNWLYAWHTPFDVIPSPYMEGVREGMDERRLLETLKRRAAEKNIDISEFLEGLFDEVAVMADTLRAGSITVEDFWDRPGKAKVMDFWHETMVEKLLSLGY